jgi:hypothetical protein
MAPLKDVLAAYLRESGIGGKLHDAAVTRAWRECAAARYGQRARAVRFADGELLVEVASAAHLQELKSFTGEELRRAANQRLGSERIRRVTFKLAR